MDAPERSTPGGLITPIEPSVAAHAARAAAGSAQHAVQTTPFSRIEVAVASARGTHHADNEDAHSDLDASSGLFVGRDARRRAAPAHEGAHAEVRPRTLAQQVADQIEREVVRLSSSSHLQGGQRLGNAL